MSEKILVVDDDAVVRLMARHHLERWGYRVSEVCNAREARKCLSKKTYALILTDIVMPGESGLDLTCYVKSAYPDTIVIFLSMKEDEDTAEAALKTGAYAFLTKPLRPNEMRLFVQNGLQRRRLEKENRQYMAHLEEKVRERTLELEQAIDKLKKSRQAVQDSEEKFRVTIEHSNDGVIMLHQGQILYANSKIAEILGAASSQELIGKDLAAILHPEDRRRVMDINARRNRGDPVPDRYELMGLHKHGNRLHLEVSVAQTEYRGLSVTLGFIRDITSQKAAREKLQESEEWLRKTMEGVQAGIMIVDQSSRTIVEANPSALEMLGASREELVGKNCQASVCPIETPGRCPVIDLGHSLKNAEAFMVTASGGEIPVLKTVVPLWIKDRAYLLESFVDISELKQTEAKLTNAYAELKSLISSISSLLIHITPQASIIKWNTHAEKFFNLKEADVAGKSLFELPIPWDLKKLKAQIQQCRMEQTANSAIELGCQGPDGKNAILGLSISPHFDDHGVFSGLILMATDITEYKNMEDQFAQARKLEAIGQLAAGIAHEINTPIQYVGDNTRFLKDTFNDFSLVLNQYRQLIPAARKVEELVGPVSELDRLLKETDLEFLKGEIPMAIEQTLQGVEQVSAIVRSMKDFSQPGVEEKVLVDVNKALSSTATISRNEWKYVADLAFDLEKDLPMVLCLPGEINQVFLNILVNAAHAIADIVDANPGSKGRITVSTRSRKDGVEVRIADTGKGIDEHSRPYIFDPFYTTKEVGKGTGQGLALAYSTVVERHGGRLTFETEPGKGSTFIIQLPIQMSEDGRSII